MNRNNAHQALQPSAGSCRSERGRRYASLIIDRLNDTGHEAAASFLGCDKSTVNRLKNEHLDKLCDLLALLDIKCVPQEMQCYKPKSIESISTLAKERMDQLESPEQLIWEDY